MKPKPIIDEPIDSEIKFREYVRSLDKKDNDWQFSFVFHTKNEIDKYVNS